MVSLDDEIVKLLRYSLYTDNLFDQYVRTDAGMYAMVYDVDLRYYRYGYNGKEREESGEFGSLRHYFYRYRIYNPALGRFISVDPLVTEYPSWTPYMYAMGRVIEGMDLEAWSLWMPRCG